MMVVSKEGFDDERKLLRTVFVGNLPLKFKKKLILKEFRKFGEVESVRIRSVPIVDVSFRTFLEQAAEASLAHNMSLIDGNHIRVDRACPPRKKLKGSKRKQESRTPDSFSNKKKPKRG
uniref:RRM domain-containing protein n=1 Tax=Brassica campestris TaxID=3711 RepID=M4DZX1_BRACM